MAPELAVEYGPASGDGAGHAATQPVTATAALGAAAVARAPRRGAGRELPLVGSERRVEPPPPPPAPRGRGGARAPSRARAACPHRRGRAARAHRARPQRAVRPP